MATETKLITYREQLEARCRALKIPMGKVLMLAGVAPSSYWRIRQDKRDFGFKTALKLEKALENCQQHAKARRFTKSA